MSLNGKTTRVTDTVILNVNPFFPDVELQTFKDAYRLPGEYNESTLVYELKSAVRCVNEELIDFVLILQSVDESESLEAFDGDLPDVYKRAVMSWARAGLVPYFETINRKSAAEIQGDRGDELINEFKSAAHDAIDYLTKKIMTVAEEKGALPDVRTRFSNGFRASIL